MHFSAKGRSRPTASLASTADQNATKAKGTVPCDNCGGLQLVTWKGGGYNMTPCVFNYRNEQRIV